MELQSESLEIQAFQIGLHSFEQIFEGVVHFEFLQKDEQIQQECEVVVGE